MFLKGTLEYRTLGELQARGFVIKQNLIDPSLLRRLAEFMGVIFLDPGISRDDEKRINQGFLKKCFVIGREILYIHMIIIRYFGDNHA
jgi:hypothetical protein